MNVADLFESARDALIPEYQGLVDSADLIARPAVGFSFTDLCRTYGKLDDLMSRLIEGEEQLLDAFSLDLADATVRFDAKYPLAPELSQAIAGADNYVSIRFVDEFLTIEAFADVIAGSHWGRGVPEIPA